jgi:PilZ domain
VAHTVLIAAPEHLPALKEHGFADASAFSDADALKALEAITREKPRVIALEKLFASTSRGAALIKRIKADPALTGCEIQIVAHDGKPLTPKKAKKDAAPAAAAAAPALVEAPAATVAAPAAPLDQRGTRRAPRFAVAKGIEVMIDGNPAALINLSVVGAQVVSPTILKPNQRVRMTLPDSEGPIRVMAGVAWAAFEMPKSGPVYRAGIEFYDAEAGNVERFIDTNKVS